MELQYLFPKGIRKIFNKCAVKNSTIDKTARMDIGSTVVDSTIGKYSYIGEHTSLLHTRVGRFTSISNYCAIGGGQHPTQWVSTSPVFNNSNSILKAHLSANEYNPFVETVIGNDVWIGANCLISGGVKINDGAVIGMGSVVTKDVGPYEIWVGNPARFIKKRFDENTVEKILATEWWNWSDEKLSAHAMYFNSIESFINHLED